MAPQSAGEERDAVPRSMPEKGLYPSHLRSSLGLLLYLCGHQPFLFLNDTLLFWCELQIQMWHTDSVCLVRLTKELESDECMASFVDSVPLRCKDLISSMSVLILILTCSWAALPEIWLLVFIALFKFKKSIVIDRRQLNFVWSNTEYWLVSSWSAIKI